MGPHFFCAVAAVKRPSRNGGQWRIPPRDPSKPACVTVALAEGPVCVTVALAEGPACVTVTRPAG